MTDFDDKLKALLSEDDAAYVVDTIDEIGYYKTALGSLRGQGAGLRVISWCGAIIFSMGLIFCLWQIFHVETVRAQIIYATFAIIFNTAQIAMKLWFNMQLNRRALSHEIRKLQLVLTSRG